MKQIKLLTPQEYYPELGKDWKIKEEYITAGIYDDSVNWAMQQALDEVPGREEFKYISGEYSYYSDDDEATKQKRRDDSAKNIVKEYTRKAWKFVVDRMYESSIRKGLHAFPEKPALFANFDEFGEIYVDIRKQACDYMIEGYDAIIEADKEVNTEKIGKKTAKIWLLVYSVLLAGLIAPLIGCVPGYEHLRIVIPENVQVAVLIVYALIMAIVLFCASMPGSIIGGLAAAVHLGVFTKPDVVMDTGHIIMASIVLVPAFVLLIFMMSSAFGRKKLMKNIRKLAAVADENAVNVYRYLIFLQVWHVNGSGFFSNELKERIDNIGRIVNDVNTYRRKYKI